MSKFIKFYFTSSMLNMFRTLIHLSSGACLRLSYCITTLVVCSCVDVCWSFGVAQLQPATQIPLQPATPKLQQTSKHDQCGDTTEKSQAPDDGCINVRNMLSTEEVK